MNKRFIAIPVLSIAALLATAGAASAYTIDPATGAGFVGKGEVQTVLGLNNKQVQGLDVTFTSKSVTTQSFDWSCTKTVVQGNGVVRETVQQRANVTTTDTTAIVDAIARVKNQETGYNLLRFLGTDTAVVTDGPAVGSCPGQPSEFVFDDNLVTGDVVTVSSGLYVNGVFIPQVVPVVV